MFNSKTTKVGCIITIYIQMYRTPTDSHSSKFIRNAPSFILGKLFLEQTPLTLALF